MLSEVFDELQVGEIRYGLKHGLSVEQVALYSAPEFSWEKMVEIRKGLEHGLSMEQIKTYAKPEFAWRRMRRIRWELEGVAM